MKKLLIVLLSLGLVFTFSMTASALDVKFSGQYYLSGVYRANSTAAKEDDAVSRAFFYTRTRIQPVFTIAEGLTFTMRLDALEKQWGQTNFKNVNYSDESLSRKQNPTYEPGRGVQENVEFERAYVTFKTAIGGFQVGYQSADEWGTAFSDSGTTRPRIIYMLPLGPVTLNVIYEKFYESDTAMPYGAAKRHVDADRDTYALAPVYKFKGGNAGLLIKYYTDASQRDDTVSKYGIGYKSNTYLIAPYVKATFGPVYIEAELDYWGGKAAEFEHGANDVDLESWAGYIKAQGNFGPAFVGFQYGYASGDDGADSEKSKTYPVGGGTSWNPAMLLMNDDLNTWGGGGAGTSNPGAGSKSEVTSKKLNMMLANLYAGFKVTPKFQIDGSITWAKANEVADHWDEDLGFEFDLSFTYKIYDNLSYMAGAAYLVTGDYFKYGVAGKEVDNDYLLINKLTLNF